MVTIEHKIGDTTYRQLYTTTDYDAALFEGEDFSGSTIVGIYCEFKYHSSSEK